MKIAVVTIDMGLTGLRTPVATYHAIPFATPRMLTPQMKAQRTKAAYVRRSARTRETKVLLEPDLDDTACDVLNRAPLLPARGHGKPKIGRVTVAAQGVQPSVDLRTPIALAGVPVRLGLTRRKGQPVDTGTLLLYIPSRLLSVWHTSHTPN